MHEDDSSGLLLLFELENGALRQPRARYLGVVIFLPNELRWSDRRTPNDSDAST